MKKKLKVMTELQLWKINPKAVNAFPKHWDPSLLDFYYQGNQLFAQTKEDEIRAIGDIVLIYKNGKWSQYA